MDLGFKKLQIFISDDTSTQRCLGNKNSVLYLSQKISEELLFRDHIKIVVNQWNILCLSCPGWEDGSASTWCQVKSHFYSNRWPHTHMWTVYIFV